jgi:uncharacterized protein YlxW (UPF0749 family)
MSTGEFKSPANKLIAFFRRSRDAWKEKYMESKYSVKKLQTQVRYLKERKAELKKRVKELEAEVLELRARERKRDDEGQTVKRRTV